MQTPSDNSLEREMARSRKLAQMDHDSLIESARAEAKTEGENRLGQLVIRLFSLGRQQDAEKAANDMAYREKLYLEFGL